MAKCYKCGKSIKRVLTWKGKEYGVECWKKIALPELQAQRQAEWEEEEKAWHAECALLVEAIDATLHMVRSNYKYRVLANIADHFKEKGWISEKQYDFAWRQFNNKQCLYFYEMLHEAGEMSEAEILAKRVSLGTKKVSREAMKQAISMGLASKCQVYRYGQGMFQPGWTYGNVIMGEDELA